jgi:hypothetical protein
MSNPIGKGICVSEHCARGFQVFWVEEESTEQFGTSKCVLEIVQLGSVGLTIPVWALWLHLSNFVNLFCKTSGDFCI